jgi:hypothetical protein
MLVSESKEVKFRDPGQALNADARRDRVSLSASGSGVAGAKSRSVGQGDGSEV